MLKTSSQSQTLKQYFCIVIVLFLIINQIYMMQSFSDIGSQVNMEPASDVFIAMPSQIEQLQTEIANLAKLLQSNPGNSAPKAKPGLVQNPISASSEFKESCVLQNTQAWGGVDMEGTNAENVEDCHKKCLEHPDCEWVAFSENFNCRNCCYLKKGELLLQTKLHWIAAPRNCEHEKVYNYLKLISPERDPSQNSPDVPFLELQLESENVKMEDLNVPEIYGDGDTSKVKEFKKLFGKHRGKRNVIFALAAGYNLAKFENFVGSARRTGFNGDIVLGVRSSKMNDKIEEYLKKLTVIAYDVPTNVHFASWRYYAYYFWSLQYGDSVKIWLLDFRDTLFQANPFPKQYLKDSSTDLYLMQEAKFLTLSECKHNRGWIENCCGGRGAVKRVGGNWILNSGATLGTPHGIQIYSLSMLDFFKQIKARFPEGYGNGMTGIDQGLHNWLIWTNQINVKWKALDQGKGPCNVIGYYTNSKDGISKLFSEDRLIMNEDGSVSACIHQYDRFMGEMNDVKQKLRLPLNEVDDWLKSAKN